MFRNREIKVTVDKKDKNANNNDDYRDVRPIEVKAEAILKKLEGFGLKAAICVGAYVILDTCRQVMVAKANNPSD